ncbi:MAG: PadR family transcriptional regulator [Clostridia bacterium]|nr:PadR family transcriptional regulator [Clostridia bacterium]
MEQKAISSDLIRGHIDTIILYALQNGDKFAQQISDSIDEKSNNSYQINQATLYSSLKRLESLKLVKSYWNDSENGRRKYFQLTDAGRETVQQNLSSWSYSRSIIDKLMDCEPTPVYRTQVVEKVVEVEKIIEKPVEKIVEVVKTVDKSPVDDKILNSQPDNLEINFRSVLDGLIKSTAKNEPNNDNKPIEIQPIIKNDAVKPEKYTEKVEKPVEVQKFNEEISSTSKSHSIVTIGKIDFSDLSLKAKKEGFKLRISSRDSHVEKGNLLVNKLNLLTSTFTFILSIIAIFAFKFGFSDNINYDNTLFLVSLLFLTVFPLVNAIKFKVKPLKTIKNNLGFDSFLLSIIVVFNLTLITFAINLLCNVDFSNLSVLAFSLILPLIVYVLGCVHFLTKCLIAKSKICKI